MPGQPPQGMPQGMPPIPQMPPSGSPSPVPPPDFQPDPSHPAAAMMMQGAGPDQMAAAGRQPITDQQYAALQALLAKVKQAGQNLGSMNFVNNNKAIQSKRDGLKQVFAQLAAAGVDLSNPKSVSAFLAKLQAANPDMYQLFVKAMGVLLNENATPAATQPSVPGVS